MKLRIYIFILCILESAFVLPLQAQMLTNKGQLIHITANTIVSVDGSAVNEGTFTNNGALSVSGDWDNRSDYNPGTGTFILNGNTQQAVRHNNQNFYKLQIAGMGEKILESHVTVTQELQLTNGLVTPDQQSVFLIKEKAVINGGSNQSYINGRLFQEGTGNKFFPIGKNGRYKPVLLDQIEGVSPVAGFELFEPNLQAQPGGDLQEVSQIRYWQQTMLSGILNKAFITLSFDQTENFANIDSLVVAEANGPGGVFRSLGMSKTTGSLVEGTITSKLPISGNFFSIGVARNEVTSNLLFIPNAFSPLAALEEDRVVKIYGKNISQENLLFRIYNRWGNQVYESTSLEELSSKGWNGTNMNTGATESSGVYTYTLQGKFNTGKSFKKVGTISLIK
ncbi:hypothetical protein GXP67_06115 [Rhodocytophaga rosea]|uniref:Gliding motility-associated C-terminal domain-containing protein n=1 Tax=Rhodocytophaga rosea TaxID=2704465 RepID=A0A6C0GET8_9BACT|nr:gliding motility-associated C-terminal domain-containing protein [Rhodocytophaga rosea]QHT66262.1 hypothetical protein GXP67_06115 [Rhodocytophaga rosea]